MSATDGTAINLWAVVLTRSPDSRQPVPYIVRDHTASPHRLAVFEAEEDARREMQHFAESFPSSTYEVVHLTGENGREVQS